MVEQSTELDEAMEAIAEQLEGVDYLDFPVNPHKIQEELLALLNVKDREIDKQQLMERIIALRHMFHAEAERLAEQERLAKAEKKVYTALYDEIDEALAHYLDEEEIESFSTPSGSVTVYETGKYPVEIAEDAPEPKSVSKSWRKTKPATHTFDLDAIRKGLESKKFKLPWAKLGKRKRSVKYS